MTFPNIGKMDSKSHLCQMFGCSLLSCREVWESCLILGSTTLCCDEILLYLQPSDCSSVFWGFTEQCALISPGESLRDVKLVILSHRFCFSLEKRTLDSSRTEGNAESLWYMLILWKPMLWSRVLYSFSPFIFTPTVTSWEMSYGLSWNIWLEVLWQTW